MTSEEFFAFAKTHNAEMVDLKFTDLLGTWQHCSFPIETWDEDVFQNGVGFDGSSIRGWQGIHVSDMLAVPDPSTACIDPFFQEATVSVIANIVDPITREDYSRDPRHVARKASEHLIATGVADLCYIGPEPEFFIFDEVRYEQNEQRFQTLRTMDLDVILIKHDPERPFWATLLDGEALVERMKQELADLEVDTVIAPAMAVRCDKCLNCRGTDGLLGILPCKSKQSLAEFASKPLMNRHAEPLFAPSPQLFW